MTLLFRNDLSKKSQRRLVWVLIVLLGLCGGPFAGFTPLHLPIVSAVDEATPWNVTLHITETSGTGNTVVFGVEPNASDGQDRYDLPAPPAPPQYPFILAWFATPFSAPYDRLLNEYKHAPSTRCVWNLSVLWVSQPGNSSLTTITMTWEPPDVTPSGLISLYLYENSTVLADMLVDHSYSFPSDSGLHRFQIISESTTTDGSSAPTGNGLPVVPLVAAVILILVLLLVVGLWYRKKKT